MECGQCASKRWQQTVEASCGLHSEIWYGRDQGERDRRNPEYKYSQAHSRFGLATLPDRRTSTARKMRLASTYAPILDKLPLTLRSLMANQSTRGLVPRLCGDSTITPLICGRSSLSSCMGKSNTEASQSARCNVLKANSLIHVPSQGREQSSVAPLLYMMAPFCACRELSDSSYPI